ncbi:hypothetical protein IV38_GL000425 [Lactobacillus selangorensis]|uniref:Uncharacterized protein n=2 Tax=Lactobacillus selangorensis TaxID=81857 RepID=A0A0R2FX87_9LACO|nr:hypothetical protein IV38_GL000425 [Lactobacillus selangorensis]KRN33930.1 hypothetical protein IV40_GL000243 [Lactobacillus selangorensis]
MRMGTLFIGFNSLFALGSGVYLRKTRQPWYLMLVFPILFLGMVYWRYARYNYALVIAYLLMAYVAYGLAKPHEMQNNK